MNPCSAAASALSDDEFVLTSSSGMLDCERCASISSNADAAGIAAVRRFMLSTMGDDVVPDAGVFNTEALAPDAFVPDAFDSGAVRSGNLIFVGALVLDEWV